ncbi:MAG: amidase [Solirubrobacteraceae bacterium]|jgi:amidase|nr:amidase [Solirubrobacteraceae bacterium]
MEDSDLAFAGVARQAELIRDKELSPRELVELYLGRIERLDPRLNAFRVTFPERALAEADQAEARLGENDDRPLLGVPVAIKDNTDIAGELTPNGTGAYGEPAREDAEVVKRVRAAGAIVIGKTNVPELCMFPYGESATWGTTRNPWEPFHGPGGSSAGSGSAVASGLIGGALGSDGAGSIRIPAAWCGLFGLKPQRGRVSLAPLPEHWHGMSVAGWLTRRVADSALLYDATSGPGPGDAAVPPLPDRSYSEAARTPPGKLRIAVSVKPPPGVITSVDGEVRRAVEETAELLRSLGHDVQERQPDYGLLFLNVVARFLRGIHDDAAAVPHPQRLERRTRGMGRLGALVSSAALARARADEPKLAARVNRIFDDHDVLITPVTTRPPVEVGRWEGRGALWTLNGVARICPFTGLWNATGQPAASVPAGFAANGLPLAAQLVARPNDEATLFSLAAQIEAERPWAEHRPPVS